MMEQHHYISIGSIIELAMIRERYTNMISIPKIICVEKIIPIDEPTMVWYKIFSDFGKVVGNDIRYHYNSSDALDSIKTKTTTDPSRNPACLGVDHFVVSYRKRRNQRICIIPELTRNSMIKYDEKDDRFYIKHLQAPKPIARITKVHDIRVFPNMRDAIDNLKSTVYD